MKEYVYYSDDERKIISDELTERFETACSLYRIELASRNSNRAQKELARENTRGTSIHKFQCNFAWILHSISCDHESLIDNSIYQANALIDHINSISRME